MDANFAAQSQRLPLAQHAYLEFFPGPIIPQRHSRLITYTHVAVADGATLLYAEILQPGRKHHGQGEVFEYDLYSSALTASRPDGTPLFTEKLVAEPWRHPVRQAGVMGKFDVFANITLITPRRHAARIFDQIARGGGFAGECVAGPAGCPMTPGSSTRCSGGRPSPSRRWSGRSGSWSGKKSPACRYRRHGHGDHRWRR